MNALLDFIFSRRSVRSFLPRKVSRNQINDLLEAAMAAPSACKKDPWVFFVIEDADLKQSLSQALPNGQFLPQAPLCIVVCGDLAKAHAESLSYLLQDCSAAIENILLAANRIGLGGCWLGIHPREERIKAVTQLLELPENIIPVSAIAIGYPDGERASSRTRYKFDAVFWK